MTGEVIIKFAEQEKVLEALSQTGNVLMQFSKEQELIDLLKKTPFSTWVAFGAVVVALLNTWYVTWRADKRARGDRAHFSEESRKERNAQFEKEKYFYYKKKAEELMTKFNNMFQLELNHSLILHNIEEGNSEKYGEAHKKLLYAQEELRRLVAFHFPSIADEAKLFIDWRNSCLQDEIKTRKASINEEEVLAKYYEFNEKLRVAPDNLK